MDDNIVDILSDLKKYSKSEGDISIYRNYKKIFSTKAKSLQKISTEMRKKLDPSSRNVKIYMVGYNVSTDKKWKPSKWDYGPFRILCDQMTLTPEMEIKQLPEDHGQTIYYTPSELEKYGFKKSHISKIIRSIKKKIISFIPGKKVTITDVINGVEALK